MKKIIVKIPRNLNVPELFLDMELSKTRKKNLINKVYRLISRLVMTHQNSNSFENGFIRICSSEIKNMLHHDYTLIQNLLIRTGIINVLKGHKEGGECKRYGLNHVYQISDYEFKTITVRSKLKVKQENLLDKYFTENLQIFNEQKILENIVTEIGLRSLGTNNQRKVFKNKLGIWLQNINDIKESTYWYNKSTTNSRYNSTITNLPRIFKYHLKYDNQDLVQIDIKSSQIYILATILNKDFFKSNKKISIGRFKENLSENIDLVSAYMFSPLMLGQFSKGLKFFQFIELIKKPLVDTLIDNVMFQNFHNAPFNKDFYSHLYFMENGIEPSPEQRSRIKNDIMYVLFQDKRGHRKLVEGVRILRKYYPYVNKSIEYILGKIGKRDFALLLQRIESYLVLDCIVPRFHERYPEAPIFTIHDSVITTMPFVEGLREIMHNTLFETTGIEPGLSVEELRPQQKVPEHFIEELIESIEESSRTRQFRAYERTILDRNIRYADEFISNLNNRQY
ncbi:MAG: hypothetical protein HKP14_00915 [Bacteroidia bacterium]|nr:hypothetical protein [Bacteroidia bacterium]